MFIVVNLQEWPTNEYNLIFLMENMLFFVNANTAVISGGR
jgi:hypothetical protein